MNGHNPLLIGRSQPIAVSLQPTADAPPIVLQVWRDWRDAPDPGAQIVSTLVMMLIGQGELLGKLNHRLAALELCARESLRAGGEPSDQYAPARDAVLEICALHDAANAETPPSAPASALDSVAID